MTNKDNYVFFETSFMEGFILTAEDAGKLTTLLANSYKARKETYRDENDKQRSYFDQIDQQIRMEQISKESVQEMQARKGVDQ